MYQIGISFLLAFTGMQSVQQVKPLVEPAAQTSIVEQALNAALADQVFQRAMQQPSRQDLELITDVALSAAKVRNGVVQTRANERAPLPNTPTGFTQLSADEVFSCPGSVVDASCSMKRTGKYLGIFGLRHSAEQEITVIVALIVREVGSSSATSTGLEVIFSRTTSGEWIFRKKGAYLVS